MDEAPGRDDTAVSAAPLVTSEMPPRPASGLQRFVDWFIAGRPVTSTMRQRIQVYVIAHFAGVVLGLGLAVVLDWVAPQASAGLRWLVPMVLAIGVLPFGVRLLGRLDIMAALSAQFFVVIVLVLSHDYGGLLSPGLPWLVLAFATALYYLAPWPRWRFANLVVQAAQVAVFIALHQTGMKPAFEIAADTLLTIGLASSCALVGLMAAITFQIWSMDLAKERELEREVAVRRAAEADQHRIADELRRGRDHLAHSQRVGRIGSSEITYDSTDIAHWSESMFALFGLEPAAQAPGSDAFLAFVHPDDRARVEMYRRREAIGDYPRASEFRIIRPDGQHRWIRRQAEPIEWQDGQRRRVIATYQDVTEQKDAQQAVVDLEEQLAQAHKMEAIGQLTGGVAHDFNNLLGVLLGRLQMIDEELLDQRLGDTSMLRSWVRSCIKAVNRGATLTKSMLAFSRQQALAPVVLDVNAVVADMEDMLHRSLGESYRVEVVKSADLWRAEADAGQLQNALLNLMLNSRDATPNGGTLTIATRNRHIGPDFVAQNMDVDIGDYVELAVTDPGTGMPAETVRRAFEPFYTTKEVGKGSGLGLSMVYGFAKQSGGHVAIESEVGKGTTVRIYLPRREGQAHIEKAMIQTVATLGQKETILIVEDNEELRDVTKRQIQRMGYTVIDASHAAEALDLLQQNPKTRLMLSDIVLPFGMNGVELAERAAERFPKLIILFMSGYNDEHEALKRVEGRFPVRLLQKPFQPSELASLIRTVLGTPPAN